jgi:hypothetical protein
MRSFGRISVFDKRGVNPKRMSQPFNQNRSVKEMRHSFSYGMTRRGGENPDGSMDDFTSGKKRIRIGLDLRNSVA